MTNPIYFEKALKALDEQVGGDHYKSLEIQPSEYIVKNNLDWYSGNAIKYITRWKYKHSDKAKQIEDLEKARHYIQLLIENLNKGT